MGKLSLIMLMVLSIVLVIGLIIMANNIISTIQIDVLLMYGVIK